MNTTDKVIHRFADFYRTIIRLRDPGGCPWDRAQSLETLRPFLLEETYETLSAIEKNDIENIAEELTDVLQVLLMMAYILEEEKELPVHEMIERATTKLIRRHPHVFKEKVDKSPEEVKKQWEQIKEEVEKKDHIEAASSYPPLERAHRLQKQAAKTGFEWRNRQEILDKIEEELQEYRDAPSKQNQEEEIGDLLFAVVNLARAQNLDASICLHRSNEKFLQRFTHVQTRMKEEGLKMDQGHLDDMYRFWREKIDLNEESSKPRS